ncbi:phosphotransferase [Salinibius halmophilus]|uniref:phosphotransferase n=1 Tax=Salinibius halmophilus TaxID=1853216 RepID=UPI000E66224B|nr:phosphotransferase [Salinibius halmophilus]
MSVYTHVSKQEAQQIADHYGLGDVENLQPIKAGVTNTNYFLTTNESWVLTIFEGNSEAEVAPVLALQQRMYEHLIPVPRIAANHHTPIHYLHGKPLAVVVKLAGEHGIRCQAHVEEVGRFLARLHILSAPDQGLADQQLLGQLPRIHFPIAWVVNHVPDVSVQGVINRCSAQIASQPLPTGVVHGDLFPDNALFSDNQLTGVIDWYFACVDRLVWDLAVACVAWAQADVDLEQCLLAAYQSVRPLSAAEKRCWPAIKVLAATRFWVTRAQAEQAPDTEMVTKKSADDMFALVKHYIAQLEG